MAPVTNMRYGAKGLSPTHNHLPSNLRPIFYCAGKVLMDVRRSWHFDNDWKLIAHPESYSCWCSRLCRHSSSCSSCSPMLLSAGTEDGEGKATHMKALGAIIPPWKVLIQVENRATVDAGLLSISFCGTEVSLPVQEPRISRTELAPADHFILQT